MNKFFVPGIMYYAFLDRLSSSDIKWYSFLATVAINVMIISVGVFIESVVLMVFGTFSLQYMLWSTVYYRFYVLEQEAIVDRLKGQ